MLLLHGLFRGLCSLVGLIEVRVCVVLLDGVCCSVVSVVRVLSVVFSGLCLQIVRGDDYVVLSGLVDRVSYRCRFLYDGFFLHTIGLLPYDYLVHRLGAYGHSNTKCLGQTNNCGFAILSA